MTDLIDLDPKGAKLVLLDSTHVNSTVALSKRHVALDNGGMYTWSDVQRWIGEQWAEFLGQIRAYKRRKRKQPLVIIHHGETADLLKYASTELISRNQDDLIQHALDVLEPLARLADFFFVLRGTEAHVGQSGWMDSLIARDLGAVEPPTENGGAWKRLRLQLGGVGIDSAHHPGTSHRREHTAGGDAVRLAADVAAEYARVNQMLVAQGEEALPVPGLVTRGHNHAPADSGPINQPTRAVILPAWQLTTDFGHRLGGRVLPIGGALAMLEDGQIKELNWFTKTLPLSQPWSVLQWIAEQQLEGGK